LVLGLDDNLASIRSAYTARSTPPVTLRIDDSTTTAATNLSNNAQRTYFGTNHFAWNKVVDSEGKGEEEGNKNAMVQASKSVGKKDLQMYDHWVQSKLR
jgi:hypothetical protein